MNFDPFVLPFLIGVIFMFVLIGWRYYKWLIDLKVEDRYKFIKGLFSIKFFQAIREVISESILHRKIFRVNFFLGVMHMSLALFWFLLIVVGSVESKLYSKYPFNAPYDPVFFKYFEHNFDTFGAHRIFFFVMDLLLLLLLIAVALAVLKKIYSRLFGMRRTTRHRIVDRLARLFLWLIFPMRWLAESCTAALYNNGSFLTQTTGNLMEAFLPVQYIEYPLWWLYSSVLGGFFILLPFSRYMHIPTEVVLIFLRRFGIRNDTEIKGYANFEIQACSSCGICINTCQMADAAGMHGQQAVYFLQKLRFRRRHEDPILNCLMCQRCNYFCPVEINISHLRMLSRQAIVPSLYSDFTYLQQYSIQPPNKSFSVLFFAGCMSHLRPGTIKSFTRILELCNIQYYFIDREQTVCCGRPLFILGARKEAEQLILKNTEIFRSFDCKILISSCPICVKMFRETYQLDKHVIHHTEFLYLLLKANRLQLQPGNLTYVYHDPCELGRGLNEYHYARNVLQRIGKSVRTSHQRQRSLCCGGSLANMRIRSDQQLKITEDAWKKLTAKKPDYFITSCPRCEQTFTRVSGATPVLDIAEFVLENMLQAEKKIPSERQLVN